MLKLGILASGNLGKICLQKLKLAYKIEFVLTDKNSTGVIDFCKRKKIPIFIGNPRKNSPKDFIKDKPVDVLFSISYLFIIEKDLIAHPSKYALNIHGSLLPKYRGRTPHVWSIINNESFTGITIHKIAKEVDAGPIAEQVKLKIERSDTGISLYKKYEKLYPELILNCLKKIINKSIRFKIQNEKLATYFHKREPADGRINWDWQKERISNWVRALQHPYPGAFTFCKNQQLIINKLQQVDIGFDALQPNGLILGVTKQSLHVKTTNGVVLLSHISCVEFDKIKTGDILE